MTFTIYCDPFPGKEEEVDRFVTTTLKNFWSGQPGINGYHAYKDKLVGYPERTIRIDVKDLSALQKVLDSNEWNNHRRQFMALLARVESQIVETLV